MHLLYQVLFEAIYMPLSYLIIKPVRQELYTHPFCRGGTETLG